jgi:hypothetical protein
MAMESLVAAAALLFFVLGTHLFSYSCEEPRLQESTMTDLYIYIIARDLMHVSISRSLCSEVYVYFDGSDILSDREVEIKAHPVTTPPRVAHFHLYV